MENDPKKYIQTDFLKTLDGTAQNIELDRVSVPLSPEMIRLEGLRERYGNLSDEWDACLKCNGEIRAVCYEDHNTDNLKKLQQEISELKKHIESTQ